MHHHRLSPCISRCVLALLGVFAIAWTNTSHAETWTSLRGTHSVEAEMVGLWDGSVILQLSGGRRVSVKLNDLRSESRIQAQNLAKNLVTSRGGRVKELQGQAAAAAAPAPSPLPQPAAAPPYSPPKQGAKPGEFLQQLDDAITAGHIVAIYDALPPSYRNDVKEIVKLGAQKMNPATWQSLVGTTQKLGELIVTRQRWFLSSPRIQALPPEQYDMVESKLITFAGMLRDGLKPEAMQLQQLQTADFDQWLAERDQDIAPHLARLFQQSSGERQIMVDSEKDGVAVVNMGEAKVSYTLVEGYWVPKSLADNWAESVASWKTTFTESADGALFDNWALLLEGLAPTLESLAQARDAGQFHVAMEPAFGPAEVFATTIAATFGRSMNLASRGGPGGFDGYDEEYDEMEMEMEMEMEDEEMEMEMDMEEEDMEGDDF